MGIFEEKVQAVFDLNRFDMHPELAGLIADFEKRYPAAHESAARKATSFSNTDTASQAEAPQPCTERDKGKG